MKTCFVHLPARLESQYPILIGKGLLRNLQQWLPRELKPNKIVIITDSIVRKKYGNVLLARLKKLKFPAVLIDFPAGEASKNSIVKQKIESKMFKAGCGRDTLILALGGGVVGDLAGFVAATFMRGIPYIQIPTTLLAMVDSSVGGKTSVDTKEGKNLIGAFWQPLAVIADVDCLKTLPKAQRTCGLIEAFKMFATSDANSFYTLQKNNLEKIIYHAVRIKAGVVERDETEKGERSILNFGHTIGHAIEKCACYKILHGFAVGLGILVESKIAEILGILSRQDFETIATLYKKLGITGKTLRQWSIEKILAATTSDKKNKAGVVRYVLLKKIGLVFEKNGSFTHVVPEKVVCEAWEFIQKT